MVPGDSSKFFHVAIICSFSSLGSGPRYAQKFNHSPVVGHRDCTWCLAITNKSVMKIDVQAFV